MARRGTAIAAALLVAGAARADGFGFEGDLPALPHVLVDLTKAQQRTIEGTAGAGRAWPYPELRLTEAQRAEIRGGGGADVAWVFAARREALEGSCTCGTYNLGLIVGTKLAVLLVGLGDHLAPSEVAALEAALVDPALATDAWDPGPSVVHADADGDARGASERLRELAVRFPGDGFERRLVLRDGWIAQRVRLAAVPRVGIDGHIEEAVLLRLSAIASRPASGGEIAWPELGARLEVDGRVYLIVPGVIDAELGPPGRAWFLLEYRDGELTAAIVPGLPRRPGMVVEWDANGVR